MQEIKRERYIEQLVARRENGSIKVITGIRRCGKSYILFNLYRDHLLSTGVKDSQIIALALDDEKNRNTATLTTYSTIILLRQPPAMKKCTTSFWMRFNLQLPAMS